jgi:hypothetical protein
MAALSKTLCNIPYLHHAPFSSKYVQKNLTAYYIPVCSILLNILIEATAEDLAIY